MLVSQLPIQTIEASIQYVQIMEFTKEIAMKIIESKPVIDQAMVPYKGIEVTYVGYTDSDGNAFTWESGDEYAIVSFKAVTEYGFEQSVEDFKNEDYNSAVNHNLSMSMSVDKARELSIKTPGTLVCHFVTNKDGVEILVPRSYAPTQAVVAKTRSLASILAKSDVQVEA
jgi:hypothetical protein